MTIQQMEMKEEEKTGLSNGKHAQEVVDQSLPVTNKFAFLKNKWFIFAAFFLTLTIGLIIGLAIGMRTRTVIVTQESTWIDGVQSGHGVLVHKDPKLISPSTNTQFLVDIYNTENKIRLLQEETAGTSNADAEGSVLVLTFANEENGVTYVQSGQVTQIVIHVQTFLASLQTQNTKQGRRLQQEITVQDRELVIQATVDFLSEITGQPVNAVTVQSANYAEATVNVQTGQLKEQIEPQTSKRMLQDQSKTWDLNTNPAIIVEENVQASPDSVQKINAQGPLPVQQLPVVQSWFSRDKSSGKNLTHHKGKYSQFIKRHLKRHINNTVHEGRNAINKSTEQINQIAEDQKRNQRAKISIEGSPRSLKQFFERFGRPKKACNRCKILYRNCISRKNASRKLCRQEFLHNKNNPFQYKPFKTIVKPDTKNKTAPIIPKNKSISLNQSLHKNESNSRDAKNNSDLKRENKTNTDNNSPVQNSKNPNQTSNKTGSQTWSLAPTQPNRNSHMIPSFVVRSEDGTRQDIEATGNKIPNRLLQEIGDVLNNSQGIDAGDYIVFTVTDSS